MPVVPERTPHAAKLPNQAQTREQREFATLVKQARDAMNFVWGKLQKQSQGAVELLDRAKAVLDEHRDSASIESVLMAQTDRFHTVLVQAHDEPHHDEPLPLL